MVTKTFSQKGQALILIVLAIVGLVALTALAIDAGNSFSDRRHAQNAADTAAVAAALAKVQEQDISTIALARATSNGYSNDGVNTVTVNNPPGAGCNGTLPALPVGADPNEYIQVIIRSRVNTYFAPIIGIGTLSNCVDAIARASSGCPPVETYTIITLSLTSGTGYGFFHDINEGSLIINNGGIYDYHTSSTQAFKAKLGTLTTCGAIKVVGGVNLDQPTHVTPLPTTGAPPWPAGPGDPFAGLPTPIQPSPCIDGTKTVDWTFSPGCYTKIVLSAKTYIFNPGVYYIKAGGDFTATNSNITANEVMIYLVDGSFNLTYSTFTKTVTWTPPASGDYAGISLFQARANTSQSTIYSWSGLNLGGSIYAKSTAKFEVNLRQDGGVFNSPKIVVGVWKTMNSCPGCTVTIGDPLQSGQPIIELTK